MKDSLPFSSNSSNNDSNESYQDRRNNNYNYHMDLDRKTGSTRNTYFRDIWFRRGMEEKETKMNIFMLEGEKDFDKLSIREKGTKVAEKGNKDFKYWYCDVGTSGKLPE